MGTLHSILKYEEGIRNQFWSQQLVIQKLEKISSQQMYSRDADNDEP